MDPRFYHSGLFLEIISTLLSSSLCPKPVMNSCAQALVRSFSDPRLERTERRRLRRWLTCGTRSTRDLVFRKVQVLLFVSVCFIQTPSVNHLPHTRQTVRKVLRRNKSAFPDISHTPPTKFSHSPPMVRTQCRGAHGNHGSM